MEAILTYLFYGFCATALINVSYKLFYFLFAFAKADKNLPKSNFTPPVSIIVCAKNEAENLRQNIPKWLSQEYEKFELVLINDASWDHTQEILEKAAAEDDRISLVQVENIEAFWGSKKYALTLGIKKAKYEALLFTDADCEPASELWLSKMAGSFTEKKNLVLGYGGYKRVKNSLLNPP